MTTGRINQVTALAARTSTRCASTSSRVRSPSDSCSRPTRSTRRLPSATHRLLARADLAATRCLPSVRSPRRCGCAPDRGVHALVVRMPPFVRPNRARLFLPSLWSRTVPATLSLAEQEAALYRNRPANASVSTATDSRSLVHPTINASGGSRSRSWKVFPRLSKRFLTFIDKRRKTLSHARRSHI